MISSAHTVIGATFFARAVMTTAYPNDPTGLGNLFYPLGFIIIVLGGYQLFTENTLTPVTLVLTRLASIPSLLRLWGIVLFANVAGARYLAAHAPTVRAQGQTYEIARRLHRGEKLFEIG